MLVEHSSHLLLACQCSEGDCCSQETSKIQHTEGAQCKSGLSFMAGRTSNSHVMSRAEERTNLFCSASFSCILTMSESSLAAPPSKSSSDKSSRRCAGRLSSASPAQWHSCHGAALLVQHCSGHSDALILNRAGRRKVTQRRICVHLLHQRELPVRRSHCQTTHPHCFLLPKRPHLRLKTSLYSAGP